MARQILWLRRSFRPLGPRGIRIGSWNWNLVSPWSFPSDAGPRRRAWREGCPRSWRIRRGRACRRGGRGARTSCRLVGRKVLADQLAQSGGLGRGDGCLSRRKVKGDRVRVETLSSWHRSASRREGRGTPERPRERVTPRSGATRRGVATSGSLVEGRPMPGPPQASRLRLRWPARERTADRARIVKGHLNGFRRFSVVPANTQTA